MKRATIIGTGTTVARLDARVMPSTAFFAVNGACFAFHPVQAPQLVPVPVYRTRAAA